MKRGMLLVYESGQAHDSTVSLVVTDLLTRTKEVRAIYESFYRRGSLRVHTREEGDTRCTMSVMVGWYSQESVKNGTIRGALWMGPTNAHEPIQPRSIVVFFWAKLRWQ
jgi:hypothetical protein